MPPPSRLSRPPRWLWIALLVLAIELVYAFMVGGGSLSTWPTWTRFYDLQAAGFRSGHLYLARLPDPRVLAEKDPWDPSLRSLWLWDASLYQGHYYSYWGPLPALVLTAIGPGYGDEYATFALLSVELVAGVLLIERMARRVFARVGFGWVVGAIVLFAFASPNPWMLARPAVYEAAIGGGAGFLLLGLVFAFDAVTSEPGSRSERRALLLAGAVWALGLACRVTVGPPAVLLAAWTALLLPRTERFRALVSAITPLAVTVLLLLLYNELRFNSWLDFGASSQHSWMRQHFSWAYVLPNAYSYLLRPVSLSCHFPFVAAMSKPEPSWFLAGLGLPEGYSTAETVAGLRFVAPWFLLALPAPVLAARRASPAGLASLLPGARAFVFCGIAFTLALANGVPMMAQFIAIMRYLGDVSGALTLAGIFTVFALLDRLASPVYARRLGAAIAVALAAITIAAGLSLGMQGPMDSFARLYPASFVRVASTLSFCTDGN